MSLSTPPLPPPPSLGPDYPRWSETLRDRSHVLIRPVTPQDRPAQRAFVEALSSQAQRLRFLGELGHPIERALERLVHVDYDHEVAFVAVVAEDSQQKIVGASRYSTDAQGLRCECSVVVAEDWRGKGLGTLMMRHLIEIARARGIRSMYSIDDAADRTMAELAVHLGFRSRTDPDDSHQVIHELEL
ncbi:GNAT family N-acetyltransferase [Luteimonas sp. SJ-92]|uniref:GNAT family N-acetyltransferase n=2 Tax=Luteimonas salinisoli TaxID=2752307 RepID=A0A853JHC1_9GAMM|nr:GNAT family N-acetyltransferase [Luteimonas salinisoli]